MFDICIFKKALSISLWFALMFATKVLIIGMMFVMNDFKANISILHIFCFLPSFFIDRIMRSFIHICNF